MRIRVKICGTTSVTDALLAQRAGADAVGLIFAPSQRRVTPGAARVISLALGPATGRVGVFVNAPLDEVLRTADAARLSAVQLHGEAGEAYLRGLLAYYPVLRALSPGQPLPPAWPGLAVLLDAPRPGGGVPLDWRALRATFPAGAWLAGGLGPGNVAEAIARLSPAGVDAVSQLESAPGVKDSLKVRAFVEAVRAAEAAAVPDKSYPQ